MTCTTTTTTCSSSPDVAQKRKRARFADIPSTITVHDHDPYLYDPTDVWVDMADTKQNFRQDVLDYLDAVLETDDNEDVCGRGLEPYLPGEARKRRHARQTYACRMVDQYETLFGQQQNNANNNNNFENSKKEEERYEELRAFAGRQNAASVKHAHRLALQDAREARIIYAAAVDHHHPRVEEDLLEAMLRMDGCTSPSSNKGCSSILSSMDCSPLVRRESYTLLTTNQTATTTTTTRAT